MPDWRPMAFATRRTGRRFRGVPLPSVAGRDTDGVLHAVWSAHVPRCPGTPWKNGSGCGSGGLEGRPFRGKRHGTPPKYLSLYHQIVALSVTKCKDNCMANLRYLDSFLHFGSVPGSSTFVAALPCGAFRAPPLQAPSGSPAQSAQYVTLGEIAPPNSP